ACNSAQQNKYLSNERLLAIPFKALEFSTRELLDVYGGSFCRLGGRAADPGVGGAPKIRASMRPGTFWAAAAHKYDSRSEHAGGQSWRMYSGCKWEGYEATRLSDRSKRFP